jgi:hypothetical protein
VQAPVLKAPSNCGAGATREEAMYDTAAFQLVMIGFAFGFLMGVLI